MKKNLNAKNEELQSKICALKEKRAAVDVEIQEAMLLCTHVFAEGYDAEPIIYCTVCGRSVHDIFPNMAYEHAKKLIL